MIILRAKNRLNHSRMSISVEIFSQNRNRTEFRFYKMSFDLNNSYDLVTDEISLKK